MIFLIGAACSGKNTILAEMQNHPDFKNYHQILEYTTRPIRSNESGNEYHFIDESKYLDMFNNGEFGSRFIVNTNWYYSFKKSDLTSSAIGITNPTTLRQLQNKYQNDELISIFLNVSQRERLIRMLKRGDNISEAYRRSVHDEGHFSGVREECTFSVNCDKPPKDIAAEIFLLLQKCKK